MAVRHWVAAFISALCTSPTQAADVLLRNVNVYDGAGRPPFHADVRVRGDRIAAVASHLAPLAGEEVRDERGLALAPGFVDMHTHADRGLLQDLDAATATRQGITTILVGQDGLSNFPLVDYYHRLEATPPALNVASMVGQARCGRR